MVFFLWTIFPQDKFCFFYMRCDFKRMLAWDSWLHSIAFQTLNNQRLGDMSLVECKNPNISIPTFVGNLYIVGKQTMLITPNQVPL